MTREEAIEIFEDLYGAIEDSHGRDYDEAFRMAIELLSADTVPIEKYHELQHQFVMLGATFADLTEVVRCKDCKWYMLTDHNETEVCTNKQWDISMAVYPIISADGFCSYGERSEK